MKKLFAFLALIGLLTFGMTQTTVAQDEVTTDEVVASDDSSAVASDEASMEEPTETVTVTDETQETEGIHKVLKTKFIEGGAGFMGVVVLCLILGLAIVIERIIYLNLSSTNTKKLLENIETSLNEKGVDAALEVCRNTRGPIASIFYQGFSRMDEGVDVVEKTVISYGSVQMGLLEKGLTWVSLFIALAPMLGFMGTVIGMIQAFDSIAIAGEISPVLVASGIKEALLTTVLGLIVAIILQVFYNYLLSKVDSLVNEMEDSSISLLDIIVKYNAKK
jgi:biopolymer transport protein ExbB